MTKVFRTLRWSITRHLQYTPHYKIMQVCIHLFFNVYKVGIFIYLQYHFVGINKMVYLRFARRYTKLSF